MHRTRNRGRRGSGAEFPCNRRRVGVKHVCKPFTVIGSLLRSNEWFQHAGNRKVDGYSRFLLHPVPPRVKKGYGASQSAPTCLSDVGKDPSYPESSQRDLEPVHNRASLG